MFSFPSRVRAGYIFSIALLAGLPATAAHVAEPPFSILHSFQAAERLPEASLISDGRGNLFGTTAYGGSTDRGTVFTIKRDGTGFRRLHDFADDLNDGSYPYAALTLDSLGNLYGTTIWGGISNGGTVFTIRTDGSEFQLLHSFGGGANDGLNPYASLILDGSGNLYGTTNTGGSFGGGAIFILRTDGTGFQLLHSFAGSDGRFPTSSLTLDNFGNLYGTTTRGGSSDGGTLFTIRSDGTGFHLLRTFPTTLGDAYLPSGSLVSDGTGNLYGMSPFGGSFGGGTVFKIKTDGASFQILHSFAGGAGDGVRPVGSPVLDRAGNLYGTTYGPGDPREGGLQTIFKVRTDGTGYQLLHAFLDIREGTGPSGSLFLDSSNTLYGTMAAGGASNSGTIFSINTDGSLFQVSYEFAGFMSDGNGPYASVISDGSGYLYGTTTDGGFAHLGTVFKIRSDGSGFQLVHAFGGAANEGAKPESGLVLDRAGNLYGMTLYSGSDGSSGEGSGGGTVFKVRTDGTGFQILHTFAGGPGDGLFPFYSSLILDDAGTFYGTTSHGGTSDAGVVFKIRSDGTGFQLLHTFSGGANDGSGPKSSLFLDGSGNLYGTTSAGGGASDAGTVFRLRTDGTGFQLLHSFVFTSSSDPASPWASLVLDRSGNLYGTTLIGGASLFGTVFKVKTDGTGFQVLHSFPDNASDGGVPYASLILDGSGYLYGTISEGGPSNAGAVFTIGTDGTGYRILHAFRGDATDGKRPFASLFLEGSGTLIGTTTIGGSANLGTVFALSTGRPRPVATSEPFVPVQKH